MMHAMDNRHSSSCRTAGYAARIMDRAARFFDALRVFFFGWWPRHCGKPVCENC